MICGSTAHLPPAGNPDRLAIGSAPTYGRGYGGSCASARTACPPRSSASTSATGSSLTLLHARPDGATTEEDGTTPETTLVDRRFRFGALGAEQAGRRLSLG